MITTKGTKKIRLRNLRYHRYHHKCDAFKGKCGILEFANNSLTFFIAEDMIIIANINIHIPTKYR